MAAWGGLCFGFFSIMAFGYFDVPWWVIVGVALILLLGGSILINKDALDEPGVFCVTGLAIYGGLYCYGFLDAAAGDGGWTPLGGKNWVLALFICVLGWLLLLSREQENAAKRRLTADTEARRNRRTELDTADHDDLLTDLTAAEVGISAAQWHAWEQQRSAMAEQYEGLPPCPACGQETEAVTTGPKGIRFEPCGQKIWIRP
ncbi:hypothetical protein [Streptomyces mirabilis]|uniref:hypothetical protein n=1 Tax=Streptomyces mirabilis TaxID=68239 RepID=UPI0022512FC4|nr:hypothetical protein [Streptomyces mirabilis]MCX4428332.1 hypothetical protein [Streptomyces mirabilis]